MATTSSQYVGGGTKTVGMFSKLVSQGSSFVMEGVKNLVVKRHVSTAYFVEQQQSYLKLLLHKISHEQIGSLALQEQSRRMP